MTDDAQVGMAVLSRASGGWADDPAAGLSHLIRQAAEEVLMLGAA